MFNFPQCPLNPGDTVITYTRDSGGKGQDMAAQRAYRDAYVQHYELRVVYEFEDTMSAKSTKGRDGFNEMMQLVKSSNKPLAKGVLFWDYRRLSRGYHIGQKTLAEFRMRGYVVVNSSEYIPNTAEGYVIEAFKLYLAEQENEAKAKDVKRGIVALYDTKDSQGRYLGVWPRRVPKFFLRFRHNLGESHGMYRNDGTPRMALRIKPDPDYISVVRQAFELRASGMTYTDIERSTKLMDGLYKNYYHLKNLYTRLFANPIFKGDAYLSGQWYKDYVEPMVSRELWDAVQEVKGNGQHYDGWESNRTGTSKRALLSGICWCGCGGRVGINSCTPRKDGSATYYYSCANKRNFGNGTKCQTSNYIRHDILEPAIIDHVSQVYLTPEYVRDIVTEVNDLLAADNQATQEAKIESDIADLTSRRDNLIELGETSGSQAVLNRLVEVEAKLTAKQQELEALTVSLQPLRLDEQVAIDLLGSIRADLNGEDFRVKQLHLQALIEKVVVQTRLATIHYTFPEFMWFGTAKVPHRIAANTGNPKANTKRSQPAC